MTPRKETSKIIVHCSDTEGGDCAAIRKYHMAPAPSGKGWEDIGYHYVIDLDGKGEKGREENLLGAHCDGENHDSVGICLIGEGIGEFTENQFISLASLVTSLLRKYGLSWRDVFGHYEFPSAKAQGKTCPNFSGALLRQFIKGAMV